MSWVCLFVRSISQLSPTRGFHMSELRPICKICKITLSSKYTFARHLESEGHQGKLLRLEALSQSNKRPRAFDFSHESPLAPRVPDGATQLSEPPPLLSSAIELPEASTAEDSLEDDPVEASAAPLLAPPDSLVLAAPSVTVQLVRPSQDPSLGGIPRFLPVLTVMDGALTWCTQT